MSIQDLTPLVLMYHSVVAPGVVMPDDRENGANFYNVRIEDFCSQMEALRNSGYNVVGLGAEVDRASLDGKRVVMLTFDDGEMNNFEQAWPVLKKFGFTGHFFVTVNRIGHKGYMDWKELKELSSAGMRIGSHGLSHRILTAMGNDEIERELRESKERLEQGLNIMVDSLSIPRGFHDENILRIAFEVGYHHVFVSQLHSSLSNCVGRVAVRGAWSSKRFFQALQGRTPLKEKVFNYCKECAKYTLGGQRYDEFRNRLMRFVR